MIFPFITFEASCWSFEPVTQFSDFRFQLNRVRPIAFAASSDGQRDREMKLF